MKIVILDAYTANPGDLSWRDFERSGTVEIYQRTEPANQEEIIRRIGDAQAVITINTPIDRRIMEKCHDLKYIGLLATGYDMIDVASAGERGIVVTNVPSYATAAVSQAAIALLLEICNRVGHHDAAVKSGRWSGCQDWFFWDYPLIELYGKTAGIIGFGRIGQATGRIAKAFGMDILAHDEYPNDSGREIGSYVTKDRLLAESDIIILHCPLTDATRAMINADSISKMKDGVMLINNSRGALIDEKDLADALNCGRVRAAGLDVASVEPVSPDNPLLRAENCIITPHISWATTESRRRLISCAADNLEAYINGRTQNVIYCDSQPRI